MQLTESVANKECDEIGETKNSQQAPSRIRCLLHISEHTRTSVTLKPLPRINEEYTTATH